MRTKPILVVSIALFLASCATLTGKAVPGPATPGASQAQGDGGGQGQGLGSQQQGPSLNGDSAAAPDGRATGFEVDAVRVVGGQLVTGAPQ
jgi:hypothetical protein